MLMDLPFPRPAEPPIKPQYIVLFKGDDSDFEGNQSVDIVIDTELDTTGMKAHFRFMDFVQDFDSIPEDKTLRLVFPNAKTSEFPLGAADATLRFEDASGKFRTVSNRIHIVVTNSVPEAYDNEDSQSITVTVKGTVTWEMIEGKPPIPAPVTVDSALSQTSENPVQNKVVSKALYTGFTEWEFSGVPDGVTVVGQPEFEDTDDNWTLKVLFDGDEILSQRTATFDALDVSFTYDFDPGTGTIGFDITATRHLITPTKTSQLTNDGAPNGGGTPYATTAQVAAKQDALSAAQLANIAAVPGKANLTDLPYRLVEPGEWEFSGLPSGATNVQMSFDDVDGWTIYFDINGGSRNFSTGGLGTAEDLIVVFETFGEYGDITATRASLPGHLLDRAGNRVVVSGNTTLTLPAAITGHLRDFLVRLEISGSTVPTITFAAPTGETIVYETDGDEFPVPDEAGTWLYSFTETAAGTFAVSLKKVNAVAQGGS